MPHGPRRLLGDGLGDGPVVAGCLRLEGVPHVLLGSTKGLPARLAAPLHALADAFLCLAGQLVRPSVLLGQRPVRGVLERALLAGSLERRRIHLVGGAWFMCVAHVIGVVGRGLAGRVPGGAAHEHCEADVLEATALGAVDGGLRETRPQALGHSAGDARDDGAACGPADERDGSHQHPAEVPGGNPHESPGGFARGQLVRRWLIWPI